MKPKNKPNLCYVTFKKGTSTDKILKEKLGEKFTLNNCRISDLALTITKGETTVKVKGLDCSLYDAVFIRIPKNFYQNINPIAKQIPLDVIFPQGRRGFEIISSKLSLIQALARRKIDVPNIIFAEDVERVANNLKGVRFPVLLRVPTDKKKVMLANSIQEVASMMDALKVLEQPIYIEEYHPEANRLSLYVVGDEVVAATKTKTEKLDYQGETTNYGPRDNEKKLALDVASVLRTSLVRVDMLDKPQIVVDVNLCPYLEDVKKITKVDIFDKISSLFAEKTGTPKEGLEDEKEDKASS